MKRITRIILPVVLVSIILSITSIKSYAAPHGSNSFSADMKVLTELSAHWSDLGSRGIHYTDTFNRNGDYTKSALVWSDGKTYSEYDSVGHAHGGILMDFSPGTNGETAQSLFIRNIRLLTHGQTSDIKLDLDKTYDVTSFEDTMVSFAGNQSGYHSIYKYIYKNIGGGGSDSDAWFIGCDFSEDAHAFIYYYLGMRAENGADDDFGTIIAKSNTLYVPRMDYDMDGTSQDDMVNNLLTAALYIYRYNDVNVFGDLFSGSSESYKGIMDELNTLFTIDVDGEKTTDDEGNEEYTVNSMSIKLRCYGLIVTATGASINLESISQSEDENTVLKSYEGSKDIFDAAIGWGTGNIGLKKNNRPDSAWDSFIAGIILDSGSNSKKSDFSANIDSLINAGASSKLVGSATSNKAWFYNKTGTDVFTYKIFEVYRKLLKQAVTNSLVNDPASRVMNLKEPDAFRTLQRILKYHVKCIIDGSDMPDTVDWEATGTKIRIDNDGKVGSDTDYGLLDLYNMLENDYQRTVLYVNYHGKLTALDKDGSSFKCFQIPPLNLDSEYHAAYPGDAAEVGDLIKEKYINEGFKESGVVGGVARICSIGARYIVATSLYDIGEDDVGTGVFDIYNADLEKMVGARWYNGDDNPDDYFLSWMPARMTIIGEDGSGYLSFYEGDNSFERLVALLNNTEQAFEMFTYSIYGNDRNMSAADLREWFDNGSEGKAPKATDMFTWLTSTSGMSAWESSAVDTNFNEDEHTIELLRSIIELYDMCKFLGIEEGDWSETIDAYLGIYNDHPEFFSLLRNNNNIYAREASGRISTKEPMGAFFSLENRKMSDQWDKGFALSALYVPMETNLYDANSVIFLNDPDWVADFYYKYAFYRKALYINTDSSALVNKAVTSNESGGHKVATLRDLMNYDRDIILTIDDNFYNAKQVSDIIDKVDYGSVRNAGLDAEEDAPDTDGLVTDLGNWAAGLFDLDAGTILKTGSNQYYSQNLASNVTQFTAKANPKSAIFDSYLLSADEVLGSEDGTISSALDDYEYTVKQPYAVVSAVYKNADLYNECLRAITSDTAIFKSSKAVCVTPGTTEKDWLAIYNYAMLANLEEQLKNNTNTTLDLDAPIFCDIFGNIITESGLVIIPAAANATLCGSNWTPYTVGWSEYYNNGNRLQVNDLLDDVYTWLLGREYQGPNTSAMPQLYTNIQDVEKTNGGGYMAIDNSEVLVLRDTELTSNNMTGIIQFEMPNKNSEVVQNLFFSDAYFGKAAKIYSHTMTNLVVETLRGAPIEFIDYEYESLDGNTNISKYGVYIAYKLEELQNALISGTNGNNVGGNPIVTMPNLAFVTGVEYIMLYVFKIVFALLIVALVIQLYLDATKNSLGLRSVGKFILTCFMVLVAFTLVPKLVSWSYYKANKDLLAKESGYIMMLNYVKSYDGSEIGITSVETPETETELYIRVSDIGVAWWDIIPDVLFGNTFATVTDLYKDQLKGDAMAMQENVQLKGDGLYINVQDVYDSTNLMYMPSNDTIVNFSTALTAYTNAEDLDYGNWAEGGFWNGETYVITTQEYDNEGKGDWIIETNDRDSVVSFVLPYYVILDQLVANVNEYNASRGIKSYGWDVGANGHILTYDAITPYLKSSEFLEDGYDITGMEHAIKIELPQPNFNLAFNDNDMSKMENSLWYPSGITNSLKASRIQELNQYARDYIADNQHVLGKVPDEVFLKIFAMQLAIKYNQIFNIKNGNAIEIINVDTRDMMRFMVGDKPNVYKYYSYGFARYCYEQSGVIGVVFAALLTCVYWLTSFLKPVAMIVILALLVINCVFRKLLFHKDSRCVEGYLIGCACLCLCNYLYALMLKLSMIMTDLGTGAITALVMAFVVQLAYVAGLLGIIMIEVKDWKNSGFNEFATIGGNITSSVVHARTVVAERLISKGNSAYAESSNTVEYTHDDEVPTLSSMRSRDAEREERGTFSPD